MREQTNHDSVVHLARDILARLRWEMDNGCQGYLSPPPIEDVRQKALIVQAGEAQAEASFSKAATTENEAASSKSSQMTALQEEIGDCQRCGLCRGRKTIVFGEGNAEADLVFVGEGPGRDEDLAGRPFVGAAGQLLGKIIAAMGLGREEVYICNVVKCRPPDNRVPSPEEQLVCGRFLSRQLAIIEPKVVVTLGGTATGFLLEKQEPVGRLRGRFHPAGAWKVMPTYHPAYLLRNPSQKRPVWQDIQLVMSELELGLSGEKRKG